MLRFHPRRFAWLVALVIGLWTAVAQAGDHHYHYISLRAAELPSGFVAFVPVAINNDGVVFGWARDVSGVPHVAVYADGAVTVLQPNQPSFARAANEDGTVGGFVYIDFANDLHQAALFRGDQVELIPPRPGELTSEVTALNDSGTALVTSVDVSFQATFLLYKNGQTTPIDFGPDVTDPRLLDINDQGIISGTVGSFLFGFRFDPRTGETTLLDPLATEPLAEARDINNRGDVLGYSFVNGALERIGVWNRNGEFQTYFVEGTPAFPTVSNRLCFNDNNLIVISATNDRNSYIVPKPGERLNLADLVDNLPSGPSPLSVVFAVNNYGNMIGLGTSGFFLLERTGGED